MGAFFLTKVQVLKVTGIPTHLPVLFDLTFPAQGIFRHRIKFPAQYTELGLDESGFEKAFNQAHESLLQPNTIEEGTNLDTLADFAIKKRGIQALRGSPNAQCSPLPRKPGMECMNLRLKFSLWPLWLLVEELRNLAEYNLSCVVCFNCRAL